MARKIDKIEKEMSIDETGAGSLSVEAKRANEAARERRQKPTPLQKKIGTRFSIQFDVDVPARGKHMDPTSQTVPDMNLTVRQMIQNHTRGKGNEVNVSKPMYFEQEIPHIIDMTDVDRLREKLKKQMEDVEAFVKHEKEEKAKAEAAAKEEEKKQADEAAESSSKKEPE